MNAIILIALGGAVGALGRYGLASALQARFSHEIMGVPAATLAVNAIGSLAMGLAYVIILEKMQIGPYWRHLAMTGFLAAFTTFSTFSLDAIRLFESGHYGHAFAYIMLTTALCLGVCWLGIVVARLL